MSEQGLSLKVFRGEIRYARLRKRVPHKRRGHVPIYIPPNRRNRRVQ